MDFLDVTRSNFKRCVKKESAAMCGMCVRSRLCAFKVRGEETSQLVNASISAFSFFKAS